MSSSSEDEYLEPSPDVVARRPSTRRKVLPSSPLKVPRKKQREALMDYNEVDEESEEEEEEESDEEVVGYRNRRAVAASTKKKASSVITDEESVSIPNGTLSNGIGSSEGTGSSRSSDETENRPPPFIAYAEVVEDSSQPNGNNGEQGQSRPRKRLSIRAAVPDGRRSSMTSTVSGVGESVVPTNEVQTIYETCSQMFNANRINPQNAFNLKLLDCINQMIALPTYDKTNMQLTSSTVEIGTKIYVCRVDNAHTQVLTLASDVSAQNRRKRKDAPGGNDQQDEPGMMDEDDDMMGGDEGPGGRRHKAKKRVLKKREKFVEVDNSKLLTGLEEQNVKFVTRRNVLKKKFSDMIYEDLGFDYFSHFLEPEEENPFQSEQERNNMMSRTSIPDSFVNQMELVRLECLPFNHVTKFDPETCDLWGRSLDDVEMNRDQTGIAPNLRPIDGEFAYNPADRPAEYADEEMPEMNDTLGDMGFHDGANGDGEGIPHVSFNNIRSLDLLDTYFQRIKTLLKDSKSKFGWCGPNFVRPKATWVGQAKAVKRPKQRKEPERFDFTTINWGDKSNKFCASQSARTVFDDKVIEEWSSQKVIIPFLGVELNSYEDDLDPIDFDDESDPDYLPPIFKLFTNRYTSILQLIQGSQRRHRNNSASSGPPDTGDDGFEHDQDIEAPRDIVDEFCSQPMPEEGFNRPDACAPPESEWQDGASMSMPGFLNDDPLTNVSDVDSIRFSRKPKPIDMSLLKKAILKVLVEKLHLDDNGLPLKDEETIIQLPELMYLVLLRVGLRTEKLMSVPIFIVALMHVVADKRLFVMYEDHNTECPVVICRGKNFNHAEHIPMFSSGGIEME